MSSEAIKFDVDVIQDKQQMIDWQLAGQIEYVESSCVDVDYHFEQDKLQMFLNSVADSNNPFNNIPRLHCLSVATKRLDDGSRKLLGFVAGSTFAAIGGVPIRALVMFRLMVLPSYRKNGIGTSLLSSFRSIAEDTCTYSIGCPHIPMFGLKNDDQRRLFAAMGWSKKVDLRHTQMSPDVEWITHDD